jgi:hypothetical protein
MNWPAWGPTIVAVVTAIFMLGQITGRIRDQETTLVNHNGRLDDHDEKLTDQAVAIAKLEAWREGYNAATRKPHS